MKNKMGELVSVPVPYGTPADENVSNEEDLGSDNQNTFSYWGRLYPAQPSLKFQNLVQNEIKVGKLKSCDVCLKVEEVTNAVWVVVSRHHFSILRSTKIDSFGDVTYRVLIKDFSMNGTFLNGKRIGKGNVRTLKDNTVISVGNAQNKIFYYKDALAFVRNPRAIREKYDVCATLGSGAYGDVSLVFCKVTGHGFAMKTISKKRALTEAKADDGALKLENELRILSCIKHPNVIQLADYISCGSNKYLFLELMRGKDLFHRLKDDERRAFNALSESQAKLYFYQIASGVQYLHLNKIIHRDLKLENVLLASDQEDTLVKITDFGLSKELLSKSYLFTFCGTKLYVAPEVLESRGRKRYNGQVDVWSMGVILFICLSGHKPFSEDKKQISMDEQIKRGCYSMRHESWQNVSAEAQWIVQRMMTTNPLQRISVEELFKEPWLQDPSMIQKAKGLMGISSDSNDNFALSSAQVFKEQDTLKRSQDISPSPKPADLKRATSSSSDSPLHKRARIR